MGAWRQPVENYYLFGLRHQTVNQLNLRVGILSTFNESKTLSDHIRIEKELETTIMTTMQEFLSNKRPNILTSDEACSTVIYTPSTSIQLSVCMYFHILAFLYTLKSGIDVSPTINLSEIFHSGLYYPSHLIYLFLEQFPNTTIAFYFLLVC